MNTVCCFGSCKEFQLWPWSHPLICELRIVRIMQNFYSTVLTPWLSSSLYSLYSGKGKISASTGFQLSLDGIKIYIITRNVYLIKLDTPTLGKIFREDNCYKMVPQGDSLAFSTKAAMVVMWSLPACFTRFISHTTPLAIWYIPSLPPAHGEKVCVI